MRSVPSCQSPLDPSHSPSGQLTGEKPKPETSTISIRKWAISWNEMWEEGGLGRHPNFLKWYCRIKGKCKSMSVHPYQPCIYWMSFPPELQSNQMFEHPVLLKAQELVHLHHTEDVPAAHRKLCWTSLTLRNNWVKTLDKTLISLAVWSR